MRRTGEGELAEGEVEQPVVEAEELLTELEEDRSVVTAIYLIIHYPSIIHFPPLSIILLPPGRVRSRSPRARRRT